MRHRVLAGTYTTDHTSRGIYSLQYEDGKVSDTHLFAEIDSPKYICAEGNLVASIASAEQGAGVALFDLNGKLLDQLSYEERTSCYITIHEGRIYTANYHLGQFSVIGIDGDHLKLINTIQIREGAGCHQVLFHKDQILIPCLFLDRVMIFNSDLKYAGAIRFPAGTGPRHGVFTKDGSCLYLVSELSNELFAIDSEDYSCAWHMSVLPDGKKHLRDTAAIRLSEKEDRIYVSTRTQDILSVIDPAQQKLMQTHYCGGRHPRDFILLEDHLLVANRYSNSVVSFALNEDGTIGKEENLIEVPQAVSLAVSDQED